MPDTPTTVDLRERASFGAKPRYDLAKGVVYGVRVLGVDSQNARAYPPDVQRKALPLMEGRAVYIDHPAGKGNGRSVRDRFGRLTGLSVRDGATYADEFRFNPKHEYAPTFGWFLEHDPDGIGFSINARGGTARRDGREVVTDISHVFSVDLVDTPATNKSLFEQTSQVREAVDETAPLTDPVADATPDAGAGDPKTHLVNAITALAKSVQDGTAGSADVKKQIADILAMVDADAPGDGDESEVPDDADGETEAKMTEALTRLPSKAARWAARRLLREARRKLAAAKLPAKALTEQFLADLCEASAEKAGRMVADRAAVLGVAGGPKSFPRDGTSAKLREQADAAPTPDKLQEVVAGLLAD
jgi:hypothetical protein